MAIGAFAVAVGVACFVLLAALSLRSEHRRRRRRHPDGGPMIPYILPGDCDGDGGTDA
jgi:ABC-type Fe3+ transport system permease subunit